MTILVLCLEDSLAGSQSVGRWMAVGGASRIISQCHSGVKIATQTHSPLELPAGRTYSVCIVLIMPAFCVERMNMCKAFTVSAQFNPLEIGFVIIIKETESHKS